MTTIKKQFQRNKNAFSKFNKDEVYLDQLEKVINGIDDEIVELNKGVSEGGTVVAGDAFDKFDKLKADNYDFDPWKMDEVNDFEKLHLLTNKQKGKVKRLKPETQANINRSQKEFDRLKSSAIRIERATGSHLENLPVEDVEVFKEVFRYEDEVFGVRGVNGLRNKAFDGLSEDENTYANLIAFMKKYGRDKDGGGNKYQNLLEIINPTNNKLIREAKEHNSPIQQQIDDLKNSKK